MLGIYSDMQRMIWRILASVLHLGDVTISKSGKSGDGCHVKVNKADESKGLALLMVDSQFLNVLISKICPFLMPSSDDGKS